MIGAHCETLPETGNSPQAGMERAGFAHRALLFCVPSAYSGEQSAADDVGQRGRLRSILRFVRQHSIRATMNPPPWQFLFALIAAGSLAGGLFGLATYLVLWAIGP
jgi:hypothetical protein